MNLHKLEKQQHLQNLYVKASDEHASRCVASVGHSEIQQLGHDTAAA